MGCSPSRNNLANSVNVPKIEVTFPLSQYQKSLISETWRELQGRRSEFGIVLFIRIFDEIPRIKSYFTNIKSETKTAAEAQQDSMFLLHIKSFLGALSKAVESLDDAGQFISLVENLGKAHSDKKINTDFLHEIGAVLLKVLKEFLQDSCDDDVFQAWSELWKYLSITFKKGYGVSN